MITNGGIKEAIQDGVTFHFVNVGEGKYLRLRDVLWAFNRYLNTRGQRNVSYSTWDEIFNNHNNYTKHYANFLKAEDSEMVLRCKSLLRVASTYKSPDDFINEGVRLMHEYRLVGCEGVTPLLYDANSKYVVIYNTITLNVERIENETLFDYMLLAMSQFSIKNTKLSLCNGVFHPDISKLMSKYLWDFIVYKAYSTKETYKTIQEKVSKLRADTLVGLLQEHMDINTVNESLIELLNIGLTVSLRPKCILAHKLRKVDKSRIELSMTTRSDTVYQDTLNELDAIKSYIRIVFNAYCNHYKINPNIYQMDAMRFTQTKEILCMFDIKDKLR